MSRPQLSEPGRRGQGIVSATLLVLALCVIAPAVAQARPPRITERPAVTGTPQVGAALEAQGAWDGRPEPTATWQWMRCDGPGADTRSCQEIDGATKTTYTVQEADVGRRLRMLLTVRNEDGWAWALSSSTAEVAAAPAAPEPVPAPAPGPEPEPAPSPAPVTPAPTAPAGGVRDEQASKPRLMTPAPLVRIRGRLTRSGARITLLTVRAPRGARVTLRCTGRGCPAERWARTAALMRIKRFEGAFRAGTKLVITITKAGRIGKRTTIVIGRGKAPRRADLCVMPGARKAMRCPAA